MTVKGKTQQLDVVVGPNYRAMVIYAPKPQPGSTQNRNFICFEPMAGITNAMNLAHKGLLQGAAKHPAGRRVAGEFLGSTARILSGHGLLTRGTSSLDATNQLLHDCGASSSRWRYRRRIAQGRGGARAAGRVARGAGATARSRSVSSRRRRRRCVWRPATFRASVRTTQLTKGENGVWETERRPARSRHLPLQLQHRRRRDARSAQPVHQRIEQQRVEHGPRPRPRVRRHEERAARQRCAPSPIARRRSTTFRRMHVYTPPGYERNSDKYPVFYLLHGAGDSDDSWTSVGRAGFILDNLIAAKKAKPMLVVMPAGHTRRGAERRRARSRSQRDRRVRQRLREGRRSRTSRRTTASDRSREHGDRRPLDGRQPHASSRRSRISGKFAYIGVYSSGLLGAFPLLAGAAAGAARRAAATTPPRRDTGRRTRRSARGRRRIRRRPPTNGPSSTPRRSTTPT